MAFHSLPFPSDPGLSLVGIFQDSSFCSTFHPSFPLPIFYTPSIFTWNSVKTLSPLGVLLVYFLYWDQWPLLLGGLGLLWQTTLSRFHWDQFVQEPYHLWGGRPSFQIPLPCDKSVTDKIRCIRYVVCFPCNGMEGMGYIGNFVKLAAVPLEKTVPLVLIERVPNERKKQSQAKAWADQFLKWSYRKCSPGHRVHITDKESFPVVWAALCFSCLSEVSSTFNFSSQSLLQTTQLFSIPQLCLLCCSRTAAFSLGLKCKEPSDHAGCLLALAASQALMREKKCLHIRTVHLKM